MTGAAVDQQGQVLALSGGVGGAKLALGLYRTLAPDALTVVANTADDFEHLGLSISPDLDTVMYTLAGINNQEQGWGLAGESWNAMDALEQLGGETWFRLGDRDLATHLERSQRLRTGQALSQVTDYLCERLGITARLLPMSNDPVRTRVHTNEGELDFQQYFVGRQCEPAVQRIDFAGIEHARPHPALLDMLASDRLRAIVLCPSNPYVSVEPMLALPGVRRALRAARAPVIAVSPIVAGLAIKGPAAKMMRELAVPATAQAVAAHYGDLLQGFVIDSSDADLAPAIEASGIPVLSTPTIMNSLTDREALARAVLCFADQLRAG